MYFTVKPHVTIHLNTFKKNIGIIGIFYVHSFTLDTSRDITCRSYCTYVTVAREEITLLYNVKYTHSTVRGDIYSGFVLDNKIKSHGNIV